MDSRAPYNQPIDVFLTQADMEVMDQAYLYSQKPFDEVATLPEVDEKFLRYNSSPESIDSCPADFLLSPIESEADVAERKILDRVREYLSPHSDYIDSSSRLPFVLDDLEKSLLSVFLYEHPEVDLGLSPQLRPHPSAVGLAVSLKNPATFHFCLTRAALTRLASNDGSETARRAIEVAMIKHKGEAIRLTRDLSQQVAQGEDVEKLMGAVATLAMFDRISGADSEAAVHFAASRQIVKSMGGPAGIKLVWTSQLLFMYESVHGTSTESSVWDRRDFGSLHGDLNVFFSEVWSLWSSLVPARGASGRTSPSGLCSWGVQEALHPFALKEGSVMRECLSRSPKDWSNPTPQDRLELMFQLASLMIICSTMIEHRYDHHSLQAFIDSMHDVVAKSQVQNRPSNNIMWLLQVSDLSHAHAERVWTVGGFLWVIKHVNWNMQCMVRDWLLQFLTGMPLARAFKLDSFAFSYAS